MKKETFINSWPQSGRSWLCTLIGKTFELYSGEYDLATKFSSRGFGVDIKNLGKENLHTFPREHEDMNFTKTVNQLNKDKTVCKEMYSEKIDIPSSEVNCIFLVRGIENTLLSNYNRRIKIKNANRNFKGTFSEFIRSDVGSLETMITWLNLWADNFDKLNKCLLVRYEDLHKRCFEELRKVINFIGYSNIPDEILDQAVEFSNIENMRRIERSEGNKNHSMFSSNLHFVNTGKCEVQKDKINKSDLNYINSWVEKLNPIYGY